MLPTVEPAALMAVPGPPQCADVGPRPSDHRDHSQHNDRDPKDGIASRRRGGLEPYGRKEIGKN